MTVTSREVTITPAEWDSLRNDEAAAEVIAKLMIRIIDMRRDGAESLLEVREFREMTAEKLGVKWWIDDGAVGADQALDNKKTSRPLNDIKT
ncbi:hypothetical protein LZL87_001432 [Fusarium oxysporum]|nr:hypothetical protein LZL87_001432 [Fusarium oxysporum]